MSFVKPKNEIGVGEEILLFHISLTLHLYDCIDKTKSDT